GEAERLAQEVHEREARLNGFGDGFAVYREPDVDGHCHCALTPSCPATRVRPLAGPSAGPCRASTSSRPATKSWMAGTSPAMTNGGVIRAAPRVASRHGAAARRRDASSR